MIITKESQLNLVENFINEQEFIAYDLETTGLNPRKNLVMGIGISNSESGFYIVLHDYVGGMLTSVINSEAVKPVLELLKSKKLYTQNGSFDARFTFEQLQSNIIDAIYSDSMLAKHTVQEDSFYGLKEMATDLFGEDATLEQLLMKQSIKENGGTPNEIYKANLELLAKYCIKDCILTYKINEHYIKKIEEEGLSKFYFEDEVMPLYRNVTIPMELKGIPLDVELLTLAKKEIRQDLIDLKYKIETLIKPHCSKFEDWFLNYHYPVSRTGQFPQVMAQILDIDLPKTKAGKFSFTAKNIESLSDDCPLKKFLTYKSNFDLSKDFIKRVQLEIHGSEPMLNLSSKHHLKKIFFEELNEQAISYTDKGNPQVDEKFLESIKDKYDFIPLLLEYNKLSKIEGAYIDRFIEDNENGMFYPSFQQQRTTSGRYGSDMQQLPRTMSPEDEPSALVRKHNNRIREFFIAGKGYKFLDADYTSLEVVVFADDAGDQALLDIIKTGKDFYSQIAIEVHGLENQFSADKKSDKFLKNLNPKLRQDAKAYALGVRYGLGDWKLSKDLNIPQSEASNIINRYFKNFPGLKRSMQNYERSAKINGFVMSKAGRKRHLNRVRELYNKYGDDLADSLELWKKYHEVPSQYRRMKELRKEYNNLINNALNFPIQSLAASIVNQSSIALTKWIREKNIPAYICLNIHDQIVVRCDEKFVKVVQAKMKYFMENTITLDAPLNADPEIANNLREGH